MNAPRLSPVDITAIGLITAYGKAKFTLGEVAKILSRGDDGMAAYLHENGVTVERRGTKKAAKKLVSVYDLARLVEDKSRNVAAIRND